MTDQKEANQSGERSFKAACIQMNSREDRTKNLADSAEMIRAAAAEGCKYILTPEYTDYQHDDKKRWIRDAPYEADHPAPAFFSDLAKELGIYLHIGSLSVRVTDDLTANRSHFFAPDGRLMTTYDKIHLFEVCLPNGETHRESAFIRAGKRAVMVDTDLGMFGLSICYDIRFPYLFSSMAQAGAQIFAAPAAFTVPTGKVHWEPVLKSRALENGCYMIACGQTGDYGDKGKCYGHSMIIDPWGEVIAQAADAVGYITAEISHDRLDRIRKRFPILMHHKQLDPPDIFK